jgi:demethoxyubiquinone hydroxylase (CLK1/Coq7/Cat5 family)
VAVVRTDVSDQRIASIIRVRKTGELGTNVSSNQQAKQVGTFDWVPQETEALKRFR